MASHRMARGRKRADQILAFDPARRHAHRRSRRHGQIALAHRARLRGTQKRTRPRPFRRAKLARLPSSRNPVHRRLWIPYPRTSGDSPLRPPAAPNISYIHPSQTPRRRRSDPNGISKTRSRQSEDNSRSRWLEPSCAARVAKPSQLDHLCHNDHPTEDRRDTVEVEGRYDMMRVYLPRQRMISVAESMARSSDVKLRLPKPGFPDYIITNLLNIINFAFSNPEQT